jgi:hypothetical protein
MIGCMIKALIKVIRKNHNTGYYSPSPLKIMSQDLGKGGSVRNDE